MWKHLIKKIQLQNCTLSMYTCWKLVYVINISNFQQHKQINMKLVVHLSLVMTIYQDGASIRVRIREYSAYILYSHWYLHWLFTFTFGYFIFTLVFLRMLQMKPPHWRTHQHFECYQYSHPYPVKEDARITEYLYY